MVRALLAALLLLNLLPAQAAEPYRPDAALVEAARKEGQALWYTTLIVDQIVRPLIRAFQAQVPGVEIKFVRIDSGQQVVRLMNEAKVARVQADVWSVIDGVAPLTHGKVAATFDIASARALPPTLVDPERRWIATNLATRSLGYNTNLVPANAAPKSYQDLLDPRWKGAFAWNPNAMTGAWGFIATVLRHIGEEQGLAYLQARQTGDHAVADRDPRRARPRDRRRVRDGARDGQRPRGDQQSHRRTGRLGAARCGDDDAAGRGRHSGSAASQ